MKHLKKFETFFLSPENQPKEREYLDEIENIESNDDITNPNESDEVESETETRPEIMNSEEEENGETKEYESKKDNPVSYEKSGLKRPELADRNKNKKIEGWEKAIAKKIEKSLEDRKKK